MAKDILGRIIDEKIKFIFNACYAWIWNDGRADRFKLRPAIIKHHVRALRSLLLVPFIDGGNCGLGPGWNSRIAIAPYAQVVADNSYTFIGISHPSLATAHTSIGVVVEALNMVTVPNTASGRAAVFTVSAGETHRVFVVNQGHATINA